LLSMVIVVRFLCQEMAKTARDVSWQLLRSGNGKGDCDGAGSCAVQPNRGKEHTTLGIIGLVTLHSRRSARRKSEQRRRVGNCVQVEDGSSWRQLSVPRRDRCTQGEKGGGGRNYLAVWALGAQKRRTRSVAEGPPWAEDGKGERREGEGGQTRCAGAYQRSDWSRSLALANSMCSFQRREGKTCRTQLLALQINK